MVLGAGILQVPVIKKAREMGVYVIAADDDPEAVGLKYADKCIVGKHLFNLEVMLAVARNEKIDGVIHPCSEVAMNTMGYINEKMELPGIDLRTALRVTNKEKMRRAFERGGAPSPKSFGAVSFESALMAARKIDGAIIVKPSRNSGSRGITKLPTGYSEAELKFAVDRAISESRDRSAMIEQFVDGPEFSVEIIVWNKEVNVLQVTDKKTTGAPYFVELGHSQPSMFPKEIVDTVKQAAVMGVKALQVNNCACHAEVKVLDGQAYIMEIGARLGGDFISTELTHLSTGIDMVAAAINVALGDKPNLEPIAEPQGVAIRYFTPVPGKVVSIENTEALNRTDVFDAEIYVKPGDDVREVKSSLDRSGHVIVAAPTAKEAIQIAEELVNTVKIITE